MGNRFRQGTFSDSCIGPQTPRLLKIRPPRPKYRRNTLHQHLHLALVEAHRVEVEVYPERVGSPEAQVEAGEEVVSCGEGVMHCENFTMNVTRFMVPHRLVTTNIQVRVFLYSRATYTDILQFMARLCLVW